MDVKVSDFGVLADGTEAYLYSFSNGQMSFSATNFGCVITSIIIPSKIGRVDDIVLVPPTFESLLTSKDYFGSIVGRFANRISNASFSLNGNEFFLDKNEEKHCLHSGFFRWDKILWKSKIVQNDSACGICFSRLSPSGEQGFPGNLEVSVTYLLNQNNEISITYTAVSDADTPLNLTNHSYFNLSGQGALLDNHSLKLNCSNYLEVDDNLIPTGKILPVENSIFDFRSLTNFNERLDASQLSSTNGFDHTFVLDAQNEDYKPFALVVDDFSNRSMAVSTDMNSVQFYTGNSLSNVVGKNGCFYNKHSGFCLEIQRFPDSPNRLEFPSCVLKKNEEFYSKTIYSFFW